MFNKKSFFTCAIAAICNFSWASSPSPDLLVNTKDGSLESTTRAVKGIGQIVGKDPESGLYRLKLKPNANVKATKAALRKAGKIAIAINGDQGTEPRTDDQVTDHLTYLQQLQKNHKGKNDLDWSGAYQHWLHDHVNHNGVFDIEPYLRGAAHRDKMPHATLSGDGPRLTSAKWNYVGPHNEQPVPDRTYDGLGPLGGRVNAVAINPINDNIVYVATASGGVWKSGDRGVTWTPLSDYWTFLQTSSIAIDPTATNTVYVGTGDFPQAFSYGMGIMKTTDGGLTWTNYGAGTFSGKSISHIIVDPSNPQIVIATAGRSATGTGGIYRSVNGGQTWSAATVPAVSWDGLSTSVPAGNGVRTYWAAGQSSSGVNLYKSNNEGLTWSPVTTPVAHVLHKSVDIACSKIYPLVAYLYDPDSSATFSSNHIWKTVNGGTTWTNITAGFPNGDPTPGGLGAFYSWDQNDYNFYIGTSKIDNGGGVFTDGVFVGGITIVMSPDGGATWSDISLSYQSSSTALSHVDQHAFFADPLSTNTVYFGNDGGVHRMVYDPNAQTGAFSPLNLNLFNTQWYFAAIHPTDQNRAMGGLQDNANPVAVGNLNVWVNPGEGDGSQVVYDPFNPNIAYNCDQGLKVFRTTNGWATNPATDISDTGKYNGETPNMFPPLALANKGAGPSVLYAGTDHLWSWDPVNLWTGDLGGQLLGSNLRTIATCPNDNNRLYTGSDDGQLWETPDLGATWTQVDAGFSAGAAIVTISPAPTNAADVVAGFTQTPGPNLYRCTNVDSGAPVWNSVAGSGATGLPDVPVNAIARDPYAPATTWYVGTDLGIFMTTNAGSTWSNMTNPLGLPNVIVNDLRVNPTTGYLYAGTYGRGLWRVKLVSGTPLLKTFTMPALAVSGNAFPATVTLTQAAPAGGTVVSLSSDSQTVIPPATVTVPAGQTFVTFNVATLAIYLPSNGMTRHLYAAQVGKPLSASIVVYPASIISLGLNPNPATGGVDNPVATITLNAPAPFNYLVTLKSSNPAIASVPATVIVPQGQKTVTFTVTTTQPQSTTQVTITASKNNIRSAILTVN